MMLAEDEDSQYNPSVEWQVRRGGGLEATGEELGPARLPVLSVYGHNRRFAARVSFERL